MNLGFTKKRFKLKTNYSAKLNGSCIQPIKFFWKFWHNRSSSPCIVKDCSLKQIRHIFLENNSSETWRKYNDRCNTKYVRKLPGFQVRYIVHKLLDSIKFWSTYNLMEFKNKNMVYISARTMNQEILSQIIRISFQCKTY